jgi:hypothetical protein
MKTLLLSIFLLSLCLLSNATHFRGGTITWTSYPNGTVSFFFIAYWNISYVQYVYPMSYGNGATGNVKAKFSATNPDYTTVTSSWNYKYPASPQSYTVSVHDCCRISFLRSGANQNWQLTTVVTIGQTMLTSSSSNLPPIVHFAIGNNLLPVPAQTPGIWSLSSSSLSGLTQPAFATKASISTISISQNGILNWTTGPADLGLWAVQIQHSTVQSYIVIDFIIKVENISITQDPPVISFNPNTTSYPVLVGNPVSFQVGCSTITGVEVNLTTPALFDSDMRLGSVYGQSFVQLTTPGNSVPVYTPFTWASAIISSGGTTQDFVFPFTCTNSLNGLSSTAFVLISVASPLTITCPPAATVACQLPPSSTSPIATAVSGCTGTPVISYVDQPATSNCTGGQFTRTWIATNNCLQTVNCTQILTVQDTIAPLITNIPPSSSVQCISASGVSNFGTPSVSDTCDPSPQLTQSSTYSSGQSNCNNVVTRTFTASDDCGNTATGVQVINVNDVTPPVISPNTLPSYDCPSDVDTSADVSDNCGLTALISAGPVASCGTVSLSWSFSDSCGNTATQSQAVSVGHPNGPTCQSSPSTVSCPSQVSSVSPPSCRGYCGESITPTLDFSTSTVINNCTISIVRGWLATDVCGNKASFSDSVPVKDVNPPTINVPASFNGQCGANTAVSVLGQATAEDDCGVSLVPSYYDNKASGSTSCSTVISRTWTATDACGNTATEVQQIQLTDTNPPNYVPLTEFIGQCPSQSNPSVSGYPAFSDCSIASASYSDSYTYFSPLYPACQNAFITRTWTLSDVCGNSESFAQKIIIADTQDPILHIPPPTFVDCIAKANVSNTGVATATDNCNNTLTPTYSDSIVSNIIFRTWSVVDACGNSGTATQQIFINPSLPLLTPPSNITVACLSSTSTTVTGTATASDDCTGSLSPKYDDAVSGTCPTIVTRTWSVNDTATGLTSTAVQVITVNHNNVPTVYLPADISVQCLAFAGVQYTGNATAWALCQGQITPTYSDDTTSKPGSVLRTWTATDSCGRTGSGVQTITLDDTIAPAISIPGSVQISCPTDTSVANHGTATATDNCDSPSQITISSSDQPYGPGPCFSLRRTWTATDSSDNSDSGVQLFTYVGSAPDFASAPSTIHVDCASDLANLPALTATDACGNPATVTSSDNVTSLSCGSYITRTWTAVDSCGNNNTFVQAITLFDTVAPTISAPLPVTVQCASNIPTVGVVTPSDNCGPSALSGAPTYTDFSVIPGCPMTISRRWSVTDVCGLSSGYQTQTIVVQITDLPTLTIPPSVSVPCSFPTTPDLVGTGAASAFDACGVPLTVTYDDLITEADDGTVTINRTWSTQDSCGNENSGVQVIVVLPDDPVITMPPDFFGVCGESVDPAHTGSPTWVSNCGTIESDYYDPPSCPIFGTFRRKWTLSRAGTIIFSSYQSISLADCLPSISEGIANITSVIGAIPFSVYPTIHVDDLDIPCDQLILVWIWSDGSNNTQVCDQNSPCSSCVFNGQGLDASYSHTYNYPGNYYVQLFVYDSRAQLPAFIPRALTGSPISGYGWISLSFDSIGVYDPSSGNVVGSATYFSDESFAFVEEELAGNAFLVFSARFYQSGSTGISVTGLLTLLVGTDFNFTSTSYNVLTIGPASEDETVFIATWSGQGQLNEVDGFGFTILAVDSGNEDNDLFRIQLTMLFGGVVIYDTWVEGPSFSVSSPLPGEIPNSYVSVSIEDVPPTPFSALSAFEPSADLGTASTGVLVIIIIVLAVLLAIITIICIVLFLRLRAATLISQ